MPNDNNGKSMKLRKDGSVSFDVALTVRFSFRCLNFLYFSVKIFMKKAYLSLKHKTSGGAREPDRDVT